MVEMIYICDTCNEPSETVTHEEIVETSYGNGQLVSEVITWEGSNVVALSVTNGT